MIESNLRLPGQVEDSETSLHYNYLRYYDPDVGRYIQSDPIGLAGGMNIYNYANGNPLTYMDPYGLWSWGDPLPDWLVDTAAGFGDGISGGLTRMVRNGLDIGGVNRCSAAYQRSQWAGITAGLVVPIGRAAYVYKVSQLPRAGLMAEETVAARNALKAYFRGRPLSSWMPQWSPRFGYPTLEALLEKNGGDIARVIERSGGTSLGWTVGLVGGGSLKAGHSMWDAIQNECECASH